LLAVDMAFTDLPRVDLDRSTEFSLLLGQPVSPQNPAPAGELRLYGASGRFLGLGEGLEGGRVKPSRLFVSMGEGRRSRR
jgi:hypothetical protein